MTFAAYHCFSGLKISFRHRFRPSFLVAMTLCVITTACVIMLPFYNQSRSYEMDICSRQMCQPKTNVVFLKTHKTGSCTIQNILFRHGDTKNLVFALSKNGNRFHWPRKIKRSSVLPVFLNKTHTEQFNILTQHMRFDAEQVKSFMPHDSVFVTIMREPSRLFSSALYYLPMYYDTCFNLTTANKAEDFVGNLKSIQHTRQRMCKHRNSSVPSHDFTMFDFGLDLKELDNDTRVIEKVKEIESLFSLVMITEYFDESLVLLKEQLNWKTKDIIYFRHNVVKHSRNRLSEGTVEKLREWNRADTIAYDYFTQILQNEMVKFGLERLRKEVKHLRTMCKEWETFCVEKIVIGKEMSPGDPNRPFNPMADGYVLRREARDNETCVQLTRAENPYVLVLYKKMKKRRKYIGTFL